MLAIWFLNAYFYPKLLAFLPIKFCDIKPTMLDLVLIQVFAHCDLKGIAHELYLWFIIHPALGYFFAAICINFLKRKPYQAILIVLAYCLLHEVQQFIWKDQMILILPNRIIDILFTLAGAWLCVRWEGKKSLVASR